MLTEHLRLWCSNGVHTHIPTGGPRAVLDNWVCELEIKGRYGMRHARCEAEASNHFPGQGLHVTFAKAQRAYSYMATCCHICPRGPSTFNREWPNSTSKTLCDSYALPNVIYLQRTLIQCKLLRVYTVQRIIEECGALLLLSSWKWYGRKFDDNTATCVNNSAYPLTI